MVDSETNARPSPAADSLDAAGPGGNNAGGSGRRPKPTIGPRHPALSLGQNYQGGKVKALFIVEPGRYGGDWVMPGIRLREPVELIQRFDIEGDAFFYHPTSKFLGVEIGEQRARRLLENQYDVYVLANASLKTLPAEMQFKIMEKVARGAGLLTVGKKADDFMVPKRRLAELPAWLNDAIPNVSADKKPGVPFEAYNLGKGRGVFVNYYTLALSAHDSFSREGLREYDYQMMRLGRALHWAAQREGRVAIKPLKTSMVDGVPCVEVAFTTAGDALDVEIAAEWHRCADDWRASAKPVKCKVSADNSTVTSFARQRFQPERTTTRVQAAAICSYHRPQKHGVEVRRHH